MKVTASDDGWALRGDEIYLSTLTFHCENRKGPRQLVYRTGAVNSADGCFLQYTVDSIYARSEEHEKIRDT